MSEPGNVRRVGIVFSGGPAPAANAVISAATMAFLNSGIEVIGFLDGFEDLERSSDTSPLREHEHYLRLGFDDVTDIRKRQDIILRTSRANPGKPIGEVADLADPVKNAGLMAVYHALETLAIDGLITIGGDDTLKTANYLFQLQQVVEGLRPVRLVHLPKTIDNDYYGIDWTFGFTSAANFAATEITNLSADAKSTKCWYVLEVMGRKAGWLTYASGIAGEATRMISVEDVDGVFDVDGYAEQMVDLMLAREADCPRIRCHLHRGGPRREAAGGPSTPARGRPRQSGAGLGEDRRSPGGGHGSRLSRAHRSRAVHPQQADRLRDALRRAGRVRHPARLPARRRRVPRARGGGAHGPHGVGPRSAPDRLRAVLRSRSTSTPCARGSATSTVRSDFYRLARSLEYQDVGRRG